MARSASRAGASTLESVYASKVNATSRAVTAGPSCQRARGDTWKTRVSESGHSQRSDRRHEGCVHVRAPLVSLRLHQSESLLPRQRGPIAPRGGKGIVHVHDADDLRRERDLLPAQLIGIAAAVELLVMPPDDRLDVPRELDRGQQLDAPHRVHLDDVELFARQPSGLVQDLVPDTDLADVM